MKFVILVANRIIKLSGHIVKYSCYSFHFFFPEKRFTIPDFSPPLFKTKRDSKIPRTVWITNFTNQVSLPIYINFLFNRLMAYNYEFRSAGSEEAKIEYVNKNDSPEVIDAFNRLNDGAARADLWRLLVLEGFGGVYLDIDAHLVWPLSRIIKDHQSELFVLMKHEYTNYFIAVERSHPVIKKCIDIVIENINRGKINEQGVYGLTGPTALNAAIKDNTIESQFYRFVAVQGSFTNEHFQYVDKPRGKWIHAKKENILK